MQEKWAGTTATGYSAFSMVCLIIWLSLNHYIPKENVPIFFALLTAGGLAQILAGMIQLKRGLATPGNLLLTFGTLFMLGPALTFLLVGLKLASPTPLIGYVNIFLGVLMGLYIIPLLRAPLIPFLIGPLGFFVLSTLGLTEIGYVAFKPVASFLFAVSVIYGLYMVAVGLGEEVQIHLPVGKPLMPLKMPENQGAAKTEDGLVN
ncbi:hypothetical protein DSCO28_39370 [Desulfosarcina ovata subsp. sediminis]|uniref:Uncharacterized protein n=1 Tax=Desulfosarcina ovata subsp. sediminis TaxID=885957 RepID=A0A5K7ZT21_9BACT|nr:hypothetical protein [Desulfosarcina ovata]BBO83371.1 hypothetical protein DSCO28_39370 [Desulfosarcina ovata subsp. sediminis]